MSDVTREQAWLESYLHNYLWADDDWVQVGEQSFIYWQARLPQRTTVEALPDGRAKWRVQTRIVNDVANPDAAYELCFALNSYAAGWSFAFDEEGSAVDALIAMCAPPEFDTWQLRLSEAAKLSAWMADVIAERAAEAVGGAPAFSHPAQQDSVREVFDGTFYYLEMLRGRPEWVLNLTSQLFPPMQDVAQVFKAAIGVDDSDVTADQGEIDVALGETGVRLNSSFAIHPIVGDSWHTAARFTNITAVGAAATVSSMAWHLFSDDESALMGAWTSIEGELAFEQWNTTSELRNQEQLPSQSGHRHESGDLWGLTSSINDAIHLTLNAAEGGHLATLANAQRSEEPLAAHVIGAIGDLARPALALSPMANADKTDRRLLWLERNHVLAVAAWFNPMGPSVTTLEVCSLPGENEQYLVYFLRHPSSPNYRVLGAVGGGADVLGILSDGVQMFLGGASLPHVLMLFAGPEEVSSPLPGLFDAEILRICRDAGIDLAAKTEMLKNAEGRPWDLAPMRPLDEMLSDASSRSEANPPATVSSAEVAIRAWRAQAAKPESVYPIFARLPDAWDGSLNFLMSAGNLEMFDVGRLPIRYSSIGTIDNE